MSADDIFILPFAVGVFALLILGLILMMEYENPMRPKKKKD